MKLSELKIPTGGWDIGLPGVGIMTQSTLQDEIIAIAISHDKFRVRSEAHNITKSFLPREINAMSDSEKIYWCGCGVPSEDIVVSWNISDISESEDREIDLIYMEMKTYMKRFEPWFYKKYELFLCCFQTES